MGNTHETVLLEETINGLNIKEDGIYIDGTLGGGGHTQKILEKAYKGRVVGIDQDKYALSRAKERLNRYDNFIAVHNNFENIPEILSKLNIEGVDGIVLDLGVSSFQLDIPERGFSYKYNAPLDMRMNKEQGISARHIVNGYDVEELNRIIKEYGEEKWAARIAKFIVNEREKEFIETTGQLVEIIKKAIPKQARQDGPHPAKRTFQAIRIEVNKELQILENAIKNAVSKLNNGGRICIITFHSLEDRVVKKTFNFLNQECICPPKIPMCICDKKRELKIITRKPILPSNEELEKNHRARSAKLRICEKI